MLALNLNDSFWSGYACASYLGEQNIGTPLPNTAIELTFTPARAQYYLLMATSSLGYSYASSSSSIRAEMRWVLECSSVVYPFDYMEFRPLSTNTDRAAFVGMKREYLTEQEYKFRIEYGESSSYLAYAGNSSVIAIPLEGHKYTLPSNVVETCTAALVPYMENSNYTFTDRTNTSITVYVDPNDNPTWTPIELWWAPGDENGNTSAFAQWDVDQASGYSWDVTGLDANKSYWFQARAENWRGCFTDFCNITVWSTLPNAPVLSCIDCTSDSLTWQWTDSGGGGFTIFDNDTDSPVVSGISASVTDTIETGLEPNKTYNRYIKSFASTPLEHYYAENFSVISTTSNTAWENVCTLTLPEPRAGNYLILATMQAKSCTTLNWLSMFRFVRDETNEINYVYDETDDYYHSFMSSEVLSASGSDDYKYQLQIQSEINGQPTTAQNAAIIALPLTSLNYAAIDNLTEDSAADPPGWVKHTDLTVSPLGSNVDYWIIHVSNHRVSSAGIQSYSRLHDGTNEVTYGMRDPCEDWTEWFFQGGFTVLKGISSDVTLTSEHRPPISTSYNRYVHIAAIRLNDFTWDGHADNALNTEQTWDSDTPMPAVTKTFTVTTAQNYLIMGSAAIGDSSTSAGYYPVVWLEHDNGGTSQLGEMSFYEHDQFTERATFAAMRRMYLTAGSHTVRIMFKRGQNSADHYVRNPAVVAIPLGGIVPEYSAKSNVVEICTAANIPYMDNTTDTFTDRTNESITVQVGSNGNPADTGIELWYAIGDSGGNTAAFAKWNGTLTSGYSWDVTGLVANTSYWFQARAENWRGCFTDFCNVTVWSTMPGAPTLSCIDCTSDSLTWAWSDTGGVGFIIYDNDTDLPVISDIPGSVTATIETGLDPNATYTRYMKAYLTAPLDYYYADCQSAVQSTTDASWKNACVIEDTFDAGTYLVIGTALSRATLSTTTVSYWAKCRLYKDETDEIHYATGRLNSQWRSFMSSLVFTADGVNQNSFALQIKGGDGSWPAEMQNAAIVAIKLDSLEYDFNENNTEGSTTLGSPVLHS
ncbi:MAG: hypothetical protein ACYS8W_15840, partial [Planctomycetota bacterium]